MRSTGTGRRVVVTPLALLFGLSLALAPSCNVLDSAEGQWRVRCAWIGMDEPYWDETFDVKESGGEVSSTVMNPDFHPTEPWMQLEGECEGTSCAFRVIQFEFGLEPWLICPQEDLGAPVLCVDKGAALEVECAVEHTP